MDLPAVAVVPVDAAAAARAPELASRLAAEGAAVVLVAGGDGPPPGRLAAEIEAAGGGRVAVFRLGGDGDLDALVEMVGETYRAGG